MNPLRKQVEGYGYKKIEQFLWMAEAISTKYGLSLNTQKVLEDLILYLLK